MSAYSDVYPVFVLYGLILIGFTISWARGDTEFMPGKPLTVKGYLLGMVLAFAAKGTAFAVMLDQPWYYGFVGGAITGLGFALPTILIVNGMHRWRSRKSKRSVSVLRTDWDS